jgi:MFS family permease
VSTRFAIDDASFSRFHFKSFVVGYLMTPLGPDAWRWLLASSAVPALIVPLLRLGTPESPRWLVRQGRTEEALEVVRSHIHPEATLADIEAETQETAGYRALLLGLVVSTAWAPALSQAASTRVPPPMTAAAPEASSTT